MNATLRRIKTLRASIDRTDREILRLLAKRFRDVRAIGRLKKKIGLQARQPKRWKELLSDRLARADRLGLSKRFVAQLLELIQREAIRIQKKKGVKKND